MRIPGLFFAIMAFSAQMSARAQDATWGDSSAAIYNTPAGYGSQAQTNANQGSPAFAALKNRMNRGNRPRAGCYLTAHGVVPGADKRLGPAQKLSLPENPCEELHGANMMPAPRGRANFTVVTAGAWSTAIVEGRQAPQSSEQTILNGGLDLD
jgi:hypothetical protein